MSKTIKFPPYAPDQTDLGQPATSVMLNVMPRADGYGPFQSLELFTSPLPGVCRGYFFARRGDGSIAVFAGTVTDLYLLNNTDFSWIRVSKGGVSYGGLPSTDHWQFAQFEDLVIAVQVNTVPQKFDLTSATSFADLGGSPPQAGRIAVVGFFLILTRLVSNSRRVHWSDLSGPETWTAGIGLSDFEDLPDGGQTHAVSGGDLFGLVFQDDCIRSLTYNPGSPAVFQITRIAANETLFAEYSVVNVGSKTFYCGASGFKMIDGSAPPAPIGKEQVDRSFFEDVDRGNLQLVIGASDPQTTRIYFAYKSQAGSVALFDKMIAFDYALMKWAPIQQSGEFIATLAKPGITLEQLDSIAPGAITVTGAANNGSGLVRLTLNQISNPFFSIAGQNFIVVQGVNPSYMNGTWRVNIIDSTHIDLVGSTFGAAYVSGGAIGGSLDALTFSLDSIAKSTVAQLSAFDSTNVLGFFSGPNMEATIDTEEVDGEGTKLFTTGMRPMTDASTVLCSTGYRDNANAAILFTEEDPIDDQGWAPQLVESRYQKGRIRIPAGSSWTYATGIQPDGQGAGER